MTMLVTALLASKGRMPVMNRHCMTYAARRVDDSKPFSVCYQGIIDMTGRKTFAKKPE